MRQEHTITWLEWTNKLEERGSSEALWKLSNELSIQAGINTHIDINGNSK